MVKFWLDLIRAAGDKSLQVLARDAPCARTHFAPAQELSPQPGCYSRVPHLQQPGDLLGRQKPGTVTQIQILTLVRFQHYLPR